MRGRNLASSLPLKGLMLVEFSDCGYVRAVKSNRPGWWPRLWLSLLLAAPGELHAAAGVIHLRNEVIATETAPKSAVAPSAEPVRAPVSKLYIVQFTSGLEPAMRESLRVAGCDLLRYVPDNAYVARLTPAALDQLRGLPGVQWIGDYRPEYKVHSGLKSLAGSTTKAGPANVSVVLAPRLNGKEFFAIRRRFATIQHESRSRFGTVIQGTLPGDALNALADLSAVLWIEPAPHMRLFDEIASKLVGGDDGTNATRTVTQQLGFDGRGVAVSVADSGLHEGDAAAMHPDLAGRVDAFFSYGSLTDASDEHGHGTHVTGIIAGNAAGDEQDDNGFWYGLGVAPGAHIVAQRIFDGVGNYEAPPSFGALTRDAVRAGAVIGSNSWGDDTQGNYDASAAEFDALVRDGDPQLPGDQPYILEFSAGNAGPGEQTIGSPAVAKNVIATGASQNNRFDLLIYAEGQDAMADFSSRGPCADGRIKPDIVAPGTWIASAKSSLAPEDNFWSPISDLYGYMGGTSQAGPHASGAAAVFVQFYRDTHGGRTPSPALVKAALINSAVDMDDFAGTEPVPNNDEGWGRIDLTGLISSAARHEFVDQTELLTTGQAYEKRVVVAGSDLPLKITLAYTDVPALPAVALALVNDLDLEVVAPDGRLYRGNRLLDGESVPDASAPDTLNNVEEVILAEPAPGEYVVRVRATRVAEDAVVASNAVDQDFALVVSADLPLPGVGVLFMDRGFYRAPDQIVLKLIDFDLAHQPSVTVQLRGTTESAGEQITLKAQGVAGVFTNTVLTVLGAPVVDGQLQVADGDLVVATYADASPPAQRQATAWIDRLPPVISDVSVTNRFGRTLVLWATDEPATSIVHFGLPGNLASTASSAQLTDAHEVPLAGLVHGAQYQFFVVSVDEAGNATTNDNSGAFFSFVVQAAPPVLLVDAYVHGVDDESVPIDVAEYTAPLDQLGVGYEVWNVSDLGSPKAADLQPYRVVIWRLNDSFYDTTTISPTEQGAIQAYLDGGGGFFLASMEILSRLGEVPFRTNALHVGEYVPKPDPFSECDTCDEDRGVPSVEGVTGDPITDNLSLDPDYSAYPELDLTIIQIGPDLGDTFRATTNATPIFSEIFSSRAAGVRFPSRGEDSAGRVVFLSFPFDTVPMTTPAPNNRVSLLRNVLNFLAPGLQGIGTLAFDRPVYTVPSTVTMEVADADLAGQGQTSVTVSSDSLPAGVPVSLGETARPGLFRGSVGLVPVGSPAAPGQLPAKDGDQIFARYSDASTGAKVTTTADVDTVVPVISAVSAEPSYDDAIVSWETSEPTDALVQFGETPLLGRTAYTADLTFDQSVRLPGLQPNRKYYFQVVSRDAAGNVAVADNGGDLYTFQTLLPLSPPWSDNLENSGDAWFVQDSPDTESSWRLGVPANDLETQAHSPVNAWGSNLDGAPIGSASTFLISPALELSGGNRATLRFWHSYDFSERSQFDLYETGQVLIVTNGVSEPITLTNFTEFSFGWEPVEIDLTPYLGRVVYLVWDYEMLSFEFEDVPNRPGWLVDDVAVTVATEFRGTVRVTNNLAQASFTVSGPAGAVVGNGWQWTLPQAPVGQYTVTFDPVPYFQTPAPQTKSLAADVTIEFPGDYAIVDLNHNGMADGWEKDFFSTVSPDRTAQTDTDQDGATDLAEFLAGTNPVRDDSALQFSTVTREANGGMRLDWSAVPGRAYRLQGSVDLVNWVPFSDWLMATDLNSSFTLPPLNNSTALLFRLEVRP